MRIVAYAYACEPDEGSEPGAGWALARLLAGFAETHVITRANNRESIEAALPGVPEGDNLHFHYVDITGAVARWKRGQRGIRLYYLLWQRAALGLARDLHRSQPFDLAWHLTLASAWLGSNLGSLGIPFVLGPVGGGVAPPRRLVMALGPRGIAYETTRALLRFVGRRLNPNASSAWRSASLILTQNPETTAWFPRRHRAKCRIFQHALLESDAVSTRPGARPNDSFVYMGRLLPWKGVAFAIEAIAETSDARLTIFGDGPDRGRIADMIRTRDLGDRVEMRGRVSRAEVMSFLTEKCGALVFPSLHDDSPLAVAEAVAAGLPVICLDVGGPPIVAGEAAIAIDPAGTPDEVVGRIADAMSTPEKWPQEWDRSIHVIERRRDALRAILAERGVAD